MSLRDSFTKVTKIELTGKTFCLGMPSSVMVAIILLDPVVPEWGVWFQGHRRSLRVKQGFLAPRGDIPVCSAWCHANQWKPFTVLLGGTQVVPAKASQCRLAQLATDFMYPWSPSLSRSTCPVSVS